MKTLAFVMLALAAGCATDDDTDRYIAIPGNPPPPGGGGGARVTGRVCIADDLRDLSTCSSDGAGGFAVTLGNMAVVTDADGSFTIPAPPNEDAMFTVSGTNPNGLTILPTTSPFAPSAVVPAIDAELFQSILLANGVTLPDGTGSILTTVSRDGSFASGITVVSVPASAAGPFYPGASGTVFGTSGGTSEVGTALIPGLTAGVVDLLYRAEPDGIETQVNGVTVRNGGVTVLDTSLLTTGTP
jgi:hypothetical protein